LDLTKSALSFLPFARIVRLPLQVDPNLLDSSCRPPQMGSLPLALRFRSSRLASLNRFRQARIVTTAQVEDGATSGSARDNILPLYNTDLSSGAQIAAAQSQRARVSRSPVNRSPDKMLEEA